jgi:Tfp pilus assembly PilM family ATPase
VLMRCHLAIEIGKKHFKIAAARKRGTHMFLLDCIVEDISSGDDSSISARISDIINRHRWVPVTVALSLSRNMATVRNIHLPSKNSAEIVKMVELYTPRIVPFKRDEVYLSYSQAGDDEMGYSRVTMALVHVDIIKRQIKILDKVGFLIDSIVLSSQGVWRWLVLQRKQELSQLNLYVVLDIDDTSVDFLIADKNNLLFSRNIALESWDLNSEEGRNKFFGEMRQSLVIFYNEEANKKPERIFVVGEPSLDGFCAQMQQELNVGVVRVDTPYSSLIFRGIVKKNTVSVSCTSVAALALQESDKMVSFEVPEIEIKKSIREKNKDLLAFGSLFIAFCAIVVLIFFGKAYNRSVYLNNLNVANKQLQDEVGGLTGYVDSINSVKERLDFRAQPLYLMSNLQK